MSQAEADLQAIREYYEQVSPGYAQTFVEGVLKATRRLEDFPRSGRKVPEIGDEDIREVIYRRYRIVYVVDPGDDAVDVLTIFHSAKQFG